MGLVLQFGAPWSPPSQAMDKVVETLALEHSATCGGGENITTPPLAFALINGEEAEDIVELCDVSAVPTTLLYLSGVEFARITGANTVDLHDALARLVAAMGERQRSTQIVASSSGDADALHARLKNLIGDKDCVLFMKGSPQQPRCKFSRQVVDALQRSGVTYRHFDILTDNAVREGLKVYSNWPTYPQFYVKGEMVGGCDIILELDESGDLASTVIDLMMNGSSSSIPGGPDPTSSSLKDRLEDRLQTLIHRSPVMLFMKGSKEAPYCGFSRKVVDALQRVAVDFDTFDILTDDDVREGLKKLSNWPTYPQLYVKGELLGGCDIILEMLEAGELRDTIESHLDT